MENKKLSKRDLNALTKASEELHKQDSDYRRTANVEFVLFFILVLTIALAIRMFVFEPVRVSGDSMYPTLHNGERMFVTKTDYWFEEPQRGDIIICYYPGETQTCVKRIVGLPGDIVQVYNGAMHINNEIFDESEYWNGYIDSVTLPVSVPEGCVYVVGDNRNFSLDSRSTDVGPIPYSSIVGKVRSVIWPIANYRDL
ncbi:MAG: signal peptidase I [Clostridia bacterium]